MALTLPILFLRTPPRDVGPRGIPPTIAFTLALTLSLAASLAARGASTSAPVDFNHHIRPLLSDRCFACHGPDDAARKARLDLRSREAALRGGRSGTPAIQPGHPDSSELIRRLITTDPDEVMPPPESKLPPLTPDEIERVRRWIADGAEFKEHWAFIPLPEAEVPETGGTPPTVRNEIDRFVLARLQQENLSPRPEASRETLIRRVTLDLVGIPPTLAEIRAFQADPSAQAYDKVVDRLLASPHYGERMAVEWMDLARFADTYGYQADVDVDLSPWRDWVIRAFNDNLPWNDFITWQLAGDLLPHPTRDQVLATAFNRLHRQTNEGGSIEEEFRAEYVADRVETMGTAFLGLTLGCARCHEHKYDPVSQQDFYRLSGFFNSIDESGLYSHFTRATPTPVLLLWEPEAQARHAAAVQAVHKADESATALRRAFLSAPATDASNTSLTVHPPPAAAHLKFESISDHRTPDAISTNLAVLHDAPVLAPGKSGQAIRFSGDNSATLAHAGHFGRTDPFTFSLWIHPTERQDRAIVFHRSRAWTDSGSRGYECLLDQGRPYVALIHFWPGNAIAVRARESVPLTTWSHLAVTYDGSSRASGLRLYLNGARLETEIVRDHLYKDIQHRAEWGDGDVGGVHLTLAGRFRDSGFKNGLIDEFQVFNQELTPLEIAVLAGRLAPGPVAAQDWPFADLAEQRLARLDPAYRDAVHALHLARVTENDLITPVREIMVMQDLPQRRPAHVLRRGAYDAPGEVVAPGVPERIFPVSGVSPTNRLGLARWLTDPRHPLTARVAVNRIWKLHFGRGLVTTTWDFGAQGQLPSHPELLDWLARRFVDSGWNRKALHRLIVTSATYRQSSVAPPELLARDPENRLLAAGPRHRLDAEQIRDSALAASGLLVTALGGPSVKPYQPPGVWEDAGTGKSYRQDQGDKLYRRSLYTFWRRTAPPPSMLTFDATSREVCTAKREVTTTPLQALVLLNDPQFLEAARVLAERLVAQHPLDLAARARDAFESLTSRLPDPEELAVLTRLYGEQRDHFASHPLDAARVVQIGQTPSDPELPPVELAATTILTSTLMSHHEFVMKR